MPATETLTSLNLTGTLQHEVLHLTQLWERRTATHTREGRHKNSGCFSIAPRVATETQPLLSWCCMFMLTQACDSTPLHHLKVILYHPAFPPTPLIERQTSEEDYPCPDQSRASRCAPHRWPNRRLRNHLLVSPPFGEAAAVRTFGVSTLYYVPGRKYYCRASAVIKKKKKKQEVDKFMAVNAASAHSRSSAGSFTPSGSSLTLFPALTLYFF